MIAFEPILQFNDQWIDWTSYVMIQINSKKLSQNTTDRDWNRCTLIIMI